MFKLVCLALTLVLLEVSGHGMMLGPPNRSSLWRFDKTAPTNFNDNENFCGGFTTQWNIHGGKCGVCGDIYTDGHPQKNENTGTYGTGKIVETYKAGQVITTDVLLTQNHKGYFQFHLCEIKDSSKPESGEDCFKLLNFEDGSQKYEITSVMKKVFNKVQLPAGFKCNHCTLRWTYTAGNNWGICEDGTGALGCGPQETFRSCSDIKIE